MFYSNISFSGGWVTTCIQVGPGVYSPTFVHIIVNTLASTYVCTTDASGFAYGAVVGVSWLQGQFPSSLDSKQISIKELPPIVLAVRRWAPVWTNQRVLFLSDNTAVVAVINRQTAKDPLMSLLRQLIVA